MVIRKPLEMPPEVARSFVSAMKDYFAEPDPRLMLSGSDCSEALRRKLRFVSTHAR